MSLQDQLLKAGLTTKQKTRQANSDKRKKKKQQRSGVEHEATLQEQVKAKLAQDKKEKLEKDAELNAQMKKELEQKELTLRIKQILEHHHIKNCNGEAEYNFTMNKKIKKLFIDAVTHRALVNGRLALCGMDDTAYIVTAETAEKIATLDNSVVLLQNEKVVEEEIDEDDPYADYQIPDDLMW